MGIFSKDDDDSTGDDSGGIAFRSLRSGAEDFGPGDQVPKWQYDQVIEERDAARELVKRYVKRGPTRGDGALEGDAKRAVKSWEE